MKNKICVGCGNSFLSKDYRRVFCSSECYHHYSTERIHPNLTKDYFELVDTKEKAYWLGFVYADGCVQEQIGRKGEISLRFSLKLARKDEEQIDKFIIAVGANLEKKKYGIDTNKEKSKDYPYVMVRVSNKIFIDGLVNYGVIPRKTLVINLPDLGSNELDLAFLLGYFDGDGCVFDNKMSITCGNKVFLRQILDKYSLNYKISNLSKKNTLGGRTYIGKKLYLKMTENYENSMLRKRCCAHL